MQQVEQDWKTRILMECEKYHEINLRHLATLDEFTDEDFGGFLIEQGPLNQLTSLDLVGSPIGDASLAAIARAASRGHLPNLQHLILFDSQTTDEGLAHLGDAVGAGHFTGLKSLGLGSARTTDRGVGVSLAAACKGMRSNLPQLEFLIVYHALADEGLACLASAIGQGALPALEQLGIDLGFTKITHRGMTLLNQAVDQRKSPALEIFFRYDGDLARLAEITCAGCKVDVLRLLFGNKSSSRWDRTFRNLAASIIAGGLPKLKDILFNSGAVTDEGLKAFAAAVRTGLIPRLQSLCLDGTNLSEQALITMFEAMAEANWTELEGLMIDRASSLTDAGFESLANVIAAGYLPKLSSMHFCESQLGDTALKALARAATSGQLGNLTGLSLSGTKVSNEGLRELAQAALRGKLPKLRELHLNGTNVSVVDQSLLQQGNASSIVKAVLDGIELGLARVAVVGMAHVGKTSLSRRVFLDELVSPGEMSETYSIDFLRPEQLKWKPTIVCAHGAQKTVIVPQVWDFGGQWVLHGVHEDFMGPDGRTLYLLVLAADRAQQCTARSRLLEDGNGLDYWLRTIRHFAGSQASIVLAITKCDLYAEGRARPIEASLAPDDDWPLSTWTADELGARTGNAIQAIVDGCSARSAKFDIEPLRAAIQSALGSLSAVNAQVPREVMPLVQRVEEAWRTAGAATVQEFREWCKALGIEESDSLDSYLRLLSDLGFLFFFGRTDRERLEREKMQPDTQDHWLQSLPAGQRRRVSREGEVLLDRYILNPEWIKWPLYHVTRESERATRKGLIKRSELEQFVRQSDARFQARKPSFVPPPQGLEIIFAVLRDSGLCLWVESEGAYFFPRGMPSDGDNLLPDWAKPAHRDYQTADHALLRWHFLSESAIQRLIVQYYAKIVDGKCWRRGMVICRGQCETAVAAQPDEGTIAIHLKGGTPAARQRLYEQLKDELVEHNGGNPIEEKHPAWNESCAPQATLSPPQYGKEYVAPAKLRNALLECDIYPIIEFWMVTRWAEEDGFRSNAADFPAGSRKKGDLLVHVDDLLNRYHRYCNELKVKAAKSARKTASSPSTGQKTPKSIKVPTSTELASLRKSILGESNVEPHS